MNYFVKPWITRGAYVGVSGVPLAPLPVARGGLVQRPLVLPDTGNTARLFTNDMVPAPLPTQGGPAPVTAGLSSIPLWGYALGALGLWYAMRRR